MGHELLAIIHENKVYDFLFLREVCTTLDKDKIWRVDFS